MSRSEARVTTLDYRGLAMQEKKIVSLKALMAPDEEEDSDPIEGDDQTGSSA